MFGDFSFSPLSKKNHDTILYVSMWKTKHIWIQKDQPSYIYVFKDHTIPDLKHEQRMDDSGCADGQKEKKDTSASEKKEKKALGTR